MWRTLTPEENAEFCKWARQNYKPLTDISGVWHPVVQDECVKMNREKGQEIREVLDGDFPSIGDLCKDCPWAWWHNRDFPAVGDL